MGNVRKRQVLGVVTLLFVFAWRSASFAQSAPATKTQVVMLGTGTPLPDPDRSGPSTAIVPDTPELERPPAFSGCKKRTFPSERY